MGYTIRSIDLGYGNTKYTVLENEGIYGFDCFESIAPIADLDNNVHSYDVMHVPVGDDIYTVGREAHLVSNQHGARPMHEHYTETPEYTALMKGALRAMNVKVIDILVLGLPVRFYRSKYNKLKQSWTGDIYLGGGIAVTIRNVVITIQPMGGYIDYRSQFASVRIDNFSQRTLIVDPGWNTLDWMLIEGMSPLVDSTGSIEMGVSGMLNKISRRIAMAASDDLPFPPSPLLSEVDQWVRSGEISLYGGKFSTSINPYLKPGIDFIEKAVSMMMSAVEERHTIKEIVIVGGAAALYKSAIQRAFPRHNIIVSSDSVYANVRGYQLIGLQALQKYEQQQVERIEVCHE